MRKLEKGAKFYFRPSPFLRFFHIAARSRNAMRSVSYPSIPRPVFSLSPMYPSISFPPPMQAEADLPRHGMAEALTPPAASLLLIDLVQGRSSDSDGGL